MISDAVTVPVRIEAATRRISAQWARISARLMRPGDQRFERRVGRRLGKAVKPAVPRRLYSVVMLGSRCPAAFRRFLSCAPFFQRRYDVVRIASAPSSAVEPELAGVFAYHAIDRIGVRAPAFVAPLAIVL
jgi:hypothetical protein